MVFVVAVGPVNGPFHTHWSSLLPSQILQTSETEILCLNPIFYRQYKMKMVTHRVLTVQSWCCLRKTPSLYKYEMFNPINTNNIPKCARLKMFFCFQLNLLRCTISQFCHISQPCPICSFDQYAVSGSSSSLPATFLVRSRKHDQAKHFYCDFAPEHCWYSCLIKTICEVLMWFPIAKYISLLSVKEWMQWSTIRNPWAILRKDKLCHSFDTTQKDIGKVHLNAKVLMKNVKRHHSAEI